MPYLKFEHRTPLEELNAAAELFDDDEQLAFQTAQEHIAAQEPEYVASLGYIALQRAQEWLQVAYACRDELIELGHVEKSRKRAIDLAQAVPELAALEAMR